ncbi:glycosyltransferase family 39 protein [[Phormidium] sp. ETS-05]|uniref:glycosyltransferase family 39 protein n=1 Tax=[Phormidium] sp. ETS-05 TaxID=222819 RepID=UPI0018EF1A6A|nr:glycosyltransferase family 39 protein [[Phormidium] sp. ETS-05]
MSIGLKTYYKPLMINSMKKTQNYHFQGFHAVIIVVLALGIFFRFANIDKKIYWIDEVHTTLRAAGYKKLEFVENAPAGKILTIDELQTFQRLSPERGWGDTITALAGNAEHTPLYYLLTRLWMEWFGSTPAVTRSLAALLSLLVFPSLYWLCWELFRSPTVGWISMALVAVSPLQVLYAQEARQYSLLTAAILLSSAALLRALRLQIELMLLFYNVPIVRSWVIKTKEISSSKFYIKTWGIYAATVALMLYTHLLGVLVVFSHGLYVGITYRFSRAFKNYVIAAWAGVVSLFPWIVLYFINSSKIGGWIARDIPQWNLIKRWFINLNTVFLDVQVGYKQQLFDVESGLDLPLDMRHVLFYTIPLMVILVAYAIYFLCQETSKRVWVFVVTLIAGSGLALMLPDLISGGQRSGIARYLIPSYLGIQIAVAYLFTSCTIWNTTSPRQKTLWQIIFAAILTSGIISCAVSSQAETWWHKYSCYYDPEVAAIINQSQTPLVISSRERVSRLMSLSYKLKPDTKLLLVEGTDFPPITENFTDTFLFRPSGELYTSIEQNQTYQPIPLHPRGHIWRLQR